ncbi:MAG TPA: hypothetical protein VKW04_19870 [Planctomycetota bacterium]|nr:hypothetical protein [Planctomycetota bacterium]
MDFEQRRVDLEREYQGSNPFDRAYAFLAFHLEWADALSAADPEAAIRQYRLAEDCQLTIGTGATSGGEGLASMGALYEILGKRADLVERLADRLPDPAAARRRLDEALVLWKRILDDPNGLSEDTPAAERHRRLTEKLAARRSPGGR